MNPDHPTSTKKESEDNIPSKDVSEKSVLESDSTSLPYSRDNRDNEESPDKVQSSPKTLKLTLRNLFLSALLGMLAGVLLFYPILWCRNAIETYIDDHRSISKYGQKIPSELTTVLIGYKFLRNEFYRDITPIELFNGAIIGINSTYALAEKKEQNDISPSTNPSSSPSSTSDSSESPKEKASPNTLRLSQALQNYAQAVAESIKDSDLDMHYALLQDRNNDEKTLSEEFTRTMLNAINEKKVPASKLAYGALCGMTAITGDPYSTALDEKEMSDLNQDLGKENYCGIGVYIEADIHNDKQLTVIEPIEGSPADKAGLRSGDRVMAIDGKNTKDMSLEVASQSIRGPVDTKVVLTIERDGRSSYDVAVVRKAVARKSISSKMMADNTGYIRMRYFGNETGNDCRTALQELIKNKAEGIILDLRNNPGGNVDEAVAVASQFLQKDQLITSLSTPRTGRSEEHRATGNNIPSLPLITLVNGYSASASEIVAGAIKDHRRGILLGETTFGKGSVQVLRSVGSDMGLKYTIAHYLTPKLRDIHLKGIEPDIVCEAPYSNRLGDSKDKQLNEALKQMRQIVKKN